MASRQMLERLRAVRTPGGAPLAPVAGLQAVAVLAAPDAGRPAAVHFARTYLPPLAYAAPGVATSLRRAADGTASRVVATFADGTTREWATAGASDAAVFAGLTGAALPAALPKPKARGSGSKRRRRHAAAASAAAADAATAANA